MNKKEYKILLNDTIEEIIKELDEDKIGQIVAPMTKYDLQTLINICKHPSNFEVIQRAKNLIKNKYFQREKLFDHGAIGYLEEHILSDNIEYKSDLYFLVKISFLLAYNDAIKQKEFKAGYNWTYFRGQTNSEWRLTPSILRKLKKTLF